MNAFPRENATAIHNLTVGDLSVQLEAETGRLRSLRFRGHEILRGIYPAVRGTEWETLPSSVASPTLDISQNRFTVLLDARVASPDVDFSWTARIEAEALGTLRYQWRGRAHRDLLANRTGLCVLHPAEAAGAACTVEHVDGTITAGRLPSAISPHQPFKNIRAVTHHFASNAEARVQCTGDVFEMEDQRNWTDASFKTYSRPLDWPRPFSLSAGTIVDHTVTVRVRARDADVILRSEPAISCPPLPSRPPAPLPHIGFGLRRPLLDSLRARARRLRPAHVRVETTHAALTSTLAWAIPEASALNCELDLAVLGATDTPPARAHFPPRCMISLFDPTGNRAPASVLSAWQRAGFEALGTGTIHHFAELNRAHPARDGAHHFTTFGINAQVHAFDDASLFETLSQHALVARQAADIGGRRPVCIAPIVLGPTRHSADPRLRTEFGARWTLGSLAELASTGCVERVTYFELHGPEGILRENERPTPLETLLAARFEHRASMPARA